MNCVTLLSCNVRYCALYLVGYSLPRMWHKLTFLCLRAVKKSINQFSSYVQHFNCVNIVYKYVVSYTIFIPLQSPLSTDLFALVVSRGHSLKVVLNNDDSYFKVILVKFERFSAVRDNLVMLMLLYLCVASCLSGSGAWQFLLTATALRLYNILNTLILVQRDSFVQCYCALTLKTRVQLLSP